MKRILCILFIASTVLAADQPTTWLEIRQIKKDEDVPCASACVTLAVADEKAAKIALTNEIATRLQGIALTATFRQRRHYAIPQPCTDIVLTNITAGVMATATQKCLMVTEVLPKVSVNLEPEKIAVPVTSKTDSDTKLADILTKEFAGKTNYVTKTDATTGTVEP